MDTQKVALITGSAKGLGKAIALHLAKKNYIVILHYLHSQEDAENTKQFIQKDGGTAIIYQADINDKKSIEQMFNFVEQTFGRLDILINNIGNYLKKNVLEVTYEQWQEIMNNNLTSVFYTSKLAIELMKKHSFGRIINLGFASIGQIKAEPLITPYFIAKTGVLLLTKSMAKEVAHLGINIHIISPGVLENSIKKPIQDIPKARLGTFKDFCNVLDILISEENDYLTGTHIEIAGGWRL
ncbi:MAG: SDR family oxidoreductase [Bacteroidetes bacterium]|nr:MAG: SDR family oxidoreductase [Bacteroidota bacterium]